MKFSKVSAHRAPLFLGLGSLLATGTVATTGCNTDAPGSETAVAEPVKGALTVIEEVGDDRYVIAEEQIVDGPTRVVIRNSDGSVDSLTTPEAFAARLPAPETVRDSAQAWSGAAGSFDEPAESQPRRGGMGLGPLLFYSLAMNAWRPAAYAGTQYAPPPAAFRTPADQARSGERRSSFAAYQRRGLAPNGAVEARTMLDQRTRAAQPSNGRRGFGTSGTRSSGG